jgi:hypothetical protein
MLRPAPPASLLIAILGKVFPESDSPNANLNLPGETMKTKLFDGNGIEVYFNQVGWCCYLPDARILNPGSGRD